MARETRNVLFVDAGSGWGGTASYLYNLLPHLDQERIRPVVLFHEDSAAPTLDRIAGLGVPVYALSRQGDVDPLARIPARLRGLAAHGRALGRGLHAASILDLLRRHDIEVVFLNNDVHGHLPAVLAAALSGLPLLCRKAGYGHGRRLQRWLARHVDVFLAECEATRRDLLEHSVWHRQATTCYSGMDLTRFVQVDGARDRLARELGIGPGSVVIGSISRFEPGKGQPELLAAGSALLERGHDVVLVLVGDYVDDRSSSLDALRQSVPAAHRERIKLVGWRKDIVELLGLMDVFAHVPTTHLEGLPVSCLEAMAAGKPLVVSHNGGLPELMDHGDHGGNGGNGFLVPPGDVHRTADALAALVADPSLRARMGRRSRAMAEERLDIRDHAARVQQIILDAARPRTRMRAAAGAGLAALARLAPQPARRTRAGSAPAPGV